MKLGDRFQAKGGKVHVCGDWGAMCGQFIYHADVIKVSAPVSCKNCLRKLAKIRTIATLARVAK